MTPAPLPKTMTETAHTPTPWHWTIEDHSMAILSGPDYITQHVVSVSPCEACQDRAEPKEWVWGRCTTIKKADADFLVLACNSHESLTRALDNLARYADECELILRETHPAKAQSLAMRVRAARSALTPDTDKE